MTKLHLGCGDIRLDGFTNIDIRQTPATDKVMNISNLDDFTDDSVDLIYACSVLEHFSFRLVCEVLREWNRVLKKGGELVLVVPDFDILVHKYLKGRRSNPPQGLNFSPKNKYINAPLKILKYVLVGKKEGEESLLTRIRRAYGWLFCLEKRKLTMGFLGELLGGQDYPENYHKALVNEEFLRALLREAGFDKITRVGYDHFPINMMQRIHPANMAFSCLK